MQDFGLDLTSFDAAYHDPATIERIRQDVNDGKALGVQGTPTIFINDEQVRPRSYDDLSAALEDALQQ